MDLLDANDGAGEYPPSWYASAAPALKPREKLRGAVTVDVCVIGAGYTGLSAALHLARAGLDVVLLDAQRIGWGASGRNGGQVGSGLNQDQDWLEKSFGMTRARALWDMADEAKALVGALVVEHGIDCDLKTGVIHACHKQSLVGPDHACVEKLAREYGYDQITPLDRAAMLEALGTRAYHGGSLDVGAAHLNPLDYALGLAGAAARAGVRIFERSRVRGLEPDASVKVRTDEGEVSAGFALLACNGYLGGLAPPVAARVMPVNNFIIATEPLGDAMAEALIRDDVAVADSRFVVSYFRLSADRRLLFGGGESYGYRFPKDIAGMVRRRMLGIYPQLSQAASHI
jgi:gamma-glutamylputrescine oxidase